MQADKLQPIHMHKYILLKKKKKKEPSIYLSVVATMNVSNIK